MRKAIAHHSRALKRRLLANKELQKRAQRIERQRDIIKDRIIEDAELEHNAASRAQGLYHMWQARLRLRELQHRDQCAAKIQGLYRMRFAKDRVHEMRMQERRVVPAGRALALFRKNAQILRRKDDSPWVEMMDPTTNQTFYYHEKDNETQWHPPLDWVGSFVCDWEGCEAKFFRAADLSLHKRSHIWICAACDKRNTSEEFPICPACGNARGKDGQLLADRRRVMLAQRLALVQQKKLEAQERKLDIQRQRIRAEEANEKAIRLRIRQARNQRPVTQSSNRQLPPLEETSRPNTHMGLGNPRYGMKPAGRTKAGKQEGVLAQGLGETTAAVSPLNDISEVQVVRVPMDEAEIPAALLRDPLGEKGEPVLDHSKIADRVGEYIALLKPVKEAVKNAKARWKEAVDRKCFKDANSIRNELATLEKRKDALEKSVHRLRKAVKMMTEEFGRAYMDCVRNGVGRKFFRDGSMYQGMLADGIPNGRGVMQFANGWVAVCCWRGDALDRDTYVGQWKRFRHGRGVFTTVEGATYEGQWQDGVRSGYGVLKLPSGQKYEGEWLGGHMHGKGRMVSANGDVYDGEWAKSRYNGACVFQKRSGQVFKGACVEGRAEGFGSLRFPDGENYVGEWHLDRRHGKGVSVFSDGSKYSGFWRSGRFHGKGRLACKDGQVYEGDWAYGKRDGFGVNSFANGDVYTGEWRADMADGSGQYEYAGSGNLYRGKWREDKKHGEGRMQFGSGAVYIGFFEKDMLQGHGTMVYNNGDVYRGSWKADKKHGVGRYEWKVGGIFEGEWKSDMADGNGTLISTAGHKYIGEWSKNCKNGQGTMFFNDGSIYSGAWLADARTGVGKFTYHAGTVLEETYEGEYVNGVRSGNGEYRYSNGAVYSGDWSRGNFHGKGRLLDSEGNVYEGMFVKNIKHGLGCWTEHTGLQYDGEWKDNQWHGNGTLHDLDGTVFTGPFVFGVKHGPGVIRYPNGNSFSGIWERGRQSSRGVFSFVGGKPGAQPPVQLKVFGY